MIYNISKPSDMAAPQVRTALVPLDDVVAAQARVARHAVRTPILERTVVGLSVHPTLTRLHLKCEMMQPGGAFKIRGAANMIEQLTADERRRGVITYSSGNHGQAVAIVANALGMPATIVMPRTAPQVKVDAVRKLGATILVEGTTSVERKARAEYEAMRDGLSIVPSFDHEHIVAGQGTLGLEILDQLPDAGLIVAPVVGGGLIAGIAAAIKRTRPDVSVIGVEPEGANSMQQSLRAGAPVTLASTFSIADGLLPIRPGDVTFAHAQALVADIVTVSEDAIRDALRWLYSEMKLVVEPSGAVSVAAVLSGTARATMSPAAPVVAILTGGNVSAATLADLVNTEARPGSVS